MDLLIALNEAGLQAGQTSTMAVNLAKVEKEGLRQQMLSLEADEASAVATIKGALGMKGAESLALKGSMAEIISRLKNGTTGTTLYRPDLIRAALETDAATATDRIRPIPTPTRELSTYPPARRAQSWSGYRADRVIQGHRSAERPP